MNRRNTYWTLADGTTLVQVPGSTRNTLKVKPHRPNWPFPVAAISVKRSECTPKRYEDAPL